MSDEDDFTITPVQYLQAVIDHRNCFTPQEKPLIQAVIDCEADLRAKFGRACVVLDAWIESLDDQSECWNTPFGVCKSSVYPSSDWCLPCRTRAILTEEQKK